MNDRQEITVTEILLVAAIVFGLLALTLPKLKPAQAREQSGKGALADLRQVQAAKDHYATEHHRKLGDPVSMEQLVRDGYLSGAPHSLPPGSRFIVGEI